MSYFCTQLLPIIMWLLFFEQNDPLLKEILDNSKKNFTKMNDNFSPEIIEHKKDHDIWH